ncbi:DNA adenine methylase [Candidatus Sodalis pierantonius]|uniref:DNA adenine methylase n=1 Tax=Candidatus Sodalis pierantonii TaxID=1486991 RepID=UPI0011DE209C
MSKQALFEWQQKTPPEIFTDIQRAARFYYLQHLAFGGKVSGQTFGASAVRSQAVNLLRLEEQLSLAHLRLSGVTIEHLSWRTCVEKYDHPHTLFYLDPPYWKTQGYGVPFSFDEYENMARLAKSINGKMIISVNNIPEMREVFSALSQESVQLSYSLGNSKNKVSELIIMN